MPGIKQEAVMGYHRDFIGNNETDAEGKVLLSAGTAYATNSAGEAVSKGNVVTNADSMLRKDEWEKIDEAVKEIKHDTQPLVNWVMSSNLTSTLENPYGTLRVSYEVVSDMTDAIVNMDGAVKGQSEGVVYNLRTMPTPIIYKDFTLNSRQLAASRRKGEALDTYQARESARVVRDKIEELFLKGDFEDGEAKLQGITTFDYRNQVSITGGSWAAAATTGKDILQAVQKILLVAKQNKYYMGLTMFIPLEYQVKFDEDYSDDKGDMTIRQRLLQLDGLDEIVTLYTMPTDEVVLIQKSKAVIEGLKGIPLQTMQESTHHGFRFHFRVMEMFLPRLFADINGSSGIFHATITA